MKRGRPQSVLKAWCTASPVGSAILILVAYALLGAAAITCWPIGESTAHFALEDLFMWGAPVVFLGSIWGLRRWRGRGA